MTRSHGAIGVFVIASLLGGGSAPARAQNGAASAIAEKLFREGKALYAERRYDEAIEKLRASEDVEPSVGVLLSLGDAYRARGKVASAWSAYVAARDLAKTRSDARVADAEQRAAEVSPRLARLTLRVASSDDVTVTDNGLTLPRSAFGSAVPVDPGRHEIVASARGRRAFRKAEELAEGQSRDVFVPVLEKEPEGREVAVSPREGAGDTQRTAGTALIVGGAGLTVVGLVFGGLAIAKWSSVTDRCPARQCDSIADRDATQGDARAADRLAVVSTIGVVVGVVAAGAGVVLRVSAPSGAVSLSPVVGARSVGLGGTFP
jgi:hypothetical protein